MHLENSVVIRRTADEVWRFLANPLNLPKWDHGVAAVEFKANGHPSGVGFEFTTVGHPGSGPDQGRMTYRVTALDPVRRDCRAALISRHGNARFVRAAEWRTVVEDAPGGSRVTISVDYQLRSRYFWLAAILFIAGKKAGSKDMSHLKNALEIV